MINVNIGANIEITLMESAVHPLNIKIPIIAITNTIAIIPPIYIMTFSPVPNNFPRIPASISFFLRSNSPSFHSLSVEGVHYAFLIVRYTQSAPYIGGTNSEKFRCT